MFVNDIILMQISGFDIYFFNERYEAGVDLLLKLVSHLGTIGIDYLFAEDTEVFRKEKGVLTISLKEKNMNTI